MKFIENCSHWWKLWSIQLAALFGVLAAAIVASPSLVLGLIALVPERWRWLAAIITGMAAFILPTLARLVQQPKLKSDADK